MTRSTKPARHNEPYPLDDRFEHFLQPIPGRKRGQISHATWATMNRKERRAFKAVNCKPRSIGATNA